MITRAVVLAAGRGSRLQRDDPSVRLTAAQERAALAGLKALVPIHGRPYLAYALHELAEAGFREVCIVVRPGDDPVARAVSRLRPRRLRLSFAAQPRPLGTAAAVLAAEAFGEDDQFIVINGDNLYPASALAALRELDGPGLIGFVAAALVARSNVPAERLASFGLVRERDGWLQRVVEKPGPGADTSGEAALISMTCWRFDPSIFHVCRQVQPSPRGEVELPDAVALAVEAGAGFRVVPMAEGVLDLSERGDIPALEDLLAGREPAL